MENIALVPILVVVTIIVVTKNWKMFKEGKISKKYLGLNVALLLTLIWSSGYLLMVP
jgi:hypothetical protein